MPAKSKSQQKFMGMVHALQKGDIDSSDVSDKVKDVADRIGDEDAEDFASTKHSGKPEKVAKETLRKIRDAIRTELESCGYTHTVDGDKLKSPGGTGPEDREFKVDEDVDEGFGSEDTLDKKGIKEFEQWRKDNAEQLGYTLSGTSDVKEDRDYKAEYKKFQSSTKAKKYRAELNQYNRKKGTYGNGDGKDASHKGGKIVGFEKESTNRGRAEKSRLKKESINESAVSFWQDMFRPGPIPKKYIMQLIKKKGELPSKKHIKKIYRSNGNPSSSELAKTWKLLTKEKYVRAASGMWRWNKDFTGWESVTERKLSSHQKKAILIAIQMSGNMTGAAKKIEKIKKGLSNDKKVKDALQLANESINEARKYKLGDKWKKDFDYEGMLKLGIKANLKMGADKLRKLFDSYEDVNYHKASKPLWAALAQLEKGNDRIVKSLLRKFNQLSKKELAANESINEAIPSEIPRTKVRLLKINAKYLADDLMDMYKELGQSDVDSELVVQHLDTLKDKVKMMRKNVGLRESVNEARTINVEPNWEGMWRFFKRMAKTNPGDWKKVERKLGSEWLKIDKMAQQKGWKSESVNEGGMGILTSDQSDVLQGIVMRNKNKNIKAILKVAIKSGYFKNVDKKELLGYIDGAKQFVKYMKSHPMESVNEARSTNREWNKFEKAFGDFYTTVIKLGKANTKLTGDKTDEKIFLTDFTRNVGKFYSLMQSWVRGQNESVNEYDLGLTYKKGKTVKVKHKKSGKELVIVDKPNVKREYEKIGYFAESVNEKISREEWAEYPKYARKLKPYMKRLLKIPVKVRVIKQANHNPWIEVRVARWGKDVIPNDFRKKALKAIGGGRPRDMDNITYGNITAGSVSMKHDQWLKLIGNKVKSESVNETLSESQVGRRCTVKEISKWLKTLEEFRYRKVRGVDARRVASFVNRGMNEEDLPMSLRKKWEHRKYGRERHLAEKYLEIIVKDNINEDRDSEYEGQKAMAKKLRRKKLGGYSFEVDKQGNDNWSWYNKKTKKQFYATPWETLAATSPGGSGPQDIVAIEAWDEEGDEDRSIPNKARYKHSGNLNRDLANYLKIVKSIIGKLK